MSDDDKLYVYDIAAVDEVMMNEANLAGSVAIIFTLPTGKQFGIKLGQSQLAELETCLEHIRASMKAQFQKQ